MNYRKFLKTSSKTAISEYQKLEKKVTLLAGKLGYDKSALFDKAESLEEWNIVLRSKLETMTSDMKIKREENHALQLRIDAQETAINGLKNELEQKEEFLKTVRDSYNHVYENRKIEISKLTGKIDGLEKAIKLFTRDMGE